MDVSRSDVVRLVLWGLKARLETVQFSITKLKAISKQLYLLSENLHKHAMPKELIELSGSLAQQAFLIATVGYEEHQTLQKVPRHD